MPKITVHGGASNADAPLEPSPQTAEETECLGNSSSASSESKPTSTEPNETKVPKPARTTGSRSGKGRTARGSVRSTGTTGRKTGK